MTAAAALGTRNSQKLPRSALKCDYEGGFHADPAIKGHNSLLQMCMKLVF